MVLVLSVFATSLLFLGCDEDSLSVSLLVEALRACNHRRIVSSSVNAFIVAVILYSLGHYHLLAYRRHEKVNIFHPYDAALPYFRKKSPSRTCGRWFSELPTIMVLPSFQQAPSLESLYRTAMCLVDVDVATKLQSRWLTSRIGKHKRDG
jgi:hypothetical protein